MNQCEPQPEGTAECCNKRTGLRKNPTGAGFGVYSEMSETVSVMAEPSGGRRSGFPVIDP